MIGKYLVVAVSFAHTSRSSMPSEVGASGGCSVLSGAMVTSASSISFLTKPVHEIKGATGTEREVHKDV